jgi:pimeloyl-ACP methyl ester carboxylesterase
LLIPDLPGYGRNQGAGPVSVEAAAEHVRAEIRAAGFDRAHIAGHSVGGAVAVVLAHHHPEMVLSVIDVEGNFTLKDAFWSAKIAQMHAAEADALLESYREDPAGWLSRNGIEPSAERVAAATLGLRSQPASTVQAMARSVVETTARTQYLDDVREILDRGTPFHLVAGERSRDGWDVPDFVAARASSMTIQPGVGHMMMLENPAEFFGIIARLVAYNA